MKKFRPLLWFVAAVVLYALSSGPVWCVVRHMSHPIDKMRTIYFPFTLSDTTSDWFERYTMLWAAPLS
jgi:hypothetical protein